MAVGRFSLTMYYPDVSVWCHVGLSLESFTTREIASLRSRDERERERKRDLKMKASLCIISS